MKCPVCKTSDLLMAERRSVEIDYCPICRGVWLDRGELDKLIALEGDVPDPSASSRARVDEHRERERERSRDDHRYDNSRRHDDYRSGHYDQRRKRSLFDMFDFD